MLSKLLSLIAKYLWIEELGWINGIALILAIYVHEYGHYLMADDLNLKPKHPRFIPFLGAYVKHDFTLNQKKVYKVVFAGPLLGGIFGLISFYIYLLFDYNFIYQFTLYSLLINLTNLIPFSILDGGKISNTVGLKKLNLIITSILIVIAFINESYLIIIIGILGLISYFSGKASKEKLTPMSKKDKRFGAFIWVVLFIILGVHSFLILNQ